MVAPEVVKMATSGAACIKIFVKMTSFFVSVNDIVVLTCSCVCCRRSRYLSPCVSPIIDQFLAAGRGPRVTPRSPVPRQISRRFGTKPLGVDDGIKVFEFGTSPWPQHGTPCILRKGLSERGKFWKGPGNDLHISYQGGETTFKIMSDMMCF